jgi:hypothetical protein
VYRINVEEDPAAVAFLPDEHHLAVLGRDSGALRFYTLPKHVRSCFSIRLFPCNLCICAP